MRILQVQGLVAGGGAEVHTLILSQGLIERGHDVVFAAPYNEDPLMKRVTEVGCSVHFLPARPGWMRLLDIAAARELATLIRSKRIDIVHTHLWNADTIGWMAARWTKIPIVSTIHGPTMPVHLDQRWYHRVHHRIYASMLRRMDRVIAISNFVKEYTAEDLGIPAESMTVVHNCSDIDAYQREFDVAATRAESGLPLNAPLVTIVGELTGRKGIMEFIEAAAIIAQQAPLTHFVLVGRGPLEDAARTKAKELGIASQTHFLGWRPDIPELLAASDVLAVTSRKEGFGRTITEAMASSLPVVSFDSGAPREIIDDGTTGYLVPPGDIDGFGMRVSELLKNEDLRRRMGSAGLERARSHFDTPVFVDSTEKVLIEASRRFRSPRATRIDGD